MNFERLAQEHKEQVLSIFNYYVKNGTAAFPTEEFPESFFDTLLSLVEGYPAYCLVEDGLVAGFGFLSAYKPLKTFLKTAEISYFLTPDYVGQGLGNALFSKLEEDAKEQGIQNIIAEISTENTASLKFHEKHNFRHAGTLENVGNKQGHDFGVVYMQKKL